MDQFEKPWIAFLSTSEEQEENEHFTCDQVRKRMEISPENIKIYFL